MTGRLERERALTVGTYSLGNLFVVYEINRQVYPEQDKCKRERGSVNSLDDGAISGSLL